MLVALVFFRQPGYAMGWRQAFLIMLATMLVDIDHLLATPIYDPARCSIGFHPLHELIPIACYLLLCFVPPLQLRLIGIGLVIHMALDSIDCYSTNGIFYTAALPVVSCTDFSNPCYTGKQEISRVYGAVAS